MSTSLSGGDLLIPQFTAGDAAAFDPQLRMSDSAATYAEHLGPLVAEALPWTEAPHDVATVQYGTTPLPGWPGRCAHIAVADLHQPTPSVWELTDETYDTYPIGYIGYQADDTSGLHDPAHPGRGPKTPTDHEVVTFLNSMGGLEHGLHSFEARCRLGLGNGIGYTAYIANQRTGNRYTAFAMQNDQLDRTVAGRPGVQSTFWAEGVRPSARIIRNAVQYYGPEVERAYDTSVYQPGGIAVAGTVFINLR